ncbi:citrate lyase subunit gamma (acyl carrier protein) [Anaerospora hongkongensis]|jgi:citrate lyase subunit gamma (acyl carrier protein)|uniref:Citrate lyase subunit gamma (Acyl carrier protein) n=1 Tax=Anaerospora hongkongensis TaxID=244830 RepID=A0A4R1Q2P9_9FIRM|nr:citrate lyase acyl carrier protein [Anaerospora hongkongensis]TCL38768.1 citrate lyase subunit gamma (acyl carrier protein) [Anaerospora hongkongensis]
MVQLLRPAQAGTLESNDIMITVAPGEAGSGMVLELDSIVMPQYGAAIRQTIAETVAKQSVVDIYIKAVDRGALDCTIRARLLAVLARAGVIGEEALV